MMSVDVCHGLSFFCKGEMSISSIAISAGDWLIPSRDDNNRL
ncbi:hypothetical protein [Vallitalea sediminicola]